MLEKYYIKRAEEEYLHHKWIVDRLNEADFDFTYPGVDPIEVTFEDYVDPFKQTVLKEIETTELIYAIVDATMEEKDWQTFHWLQELLVKEQHEEESTSRTALDIISQSDDSSIFTKAEKIYNLLNS